jgi:asparagine synthase (glutamine-hydrolysing)
VLPFSDTEVSPARRYYRLPAAASTLSEADARAAVREALDDAVAARLVSDVPLGAFLSGGLDSSIIVSHLVEHATGRVKTFSIGFANQPRYDESAFARLVAERFGTEHQEIIVTFEDVIATIPAMLDHIAEPFADASLIPTAILSEHTRGAVTVALSGDGGDELFAGYWRYRGHDYLNRYHCVPAFIRHGLIEPLARALPAGKSSRLSNRVRQFHKLLRAQSDDPLERHLAWSQILAPEAADRLFVALPSVDLVGIFESIVREGRERRRVDDPLTDILETDLLVNLPGDMLHKVDLASMRYSLEVRVPFLDRAVVELASSLPGHYKLDGGRGKQVLIDAYRDRLPAEVLARPKMGFELPIGEFLRAELRELFHDVVTPDAVAAFPLLRYDGVQSLYREHFHRRGEHADVLYAIFVLCGWHARGRRGWNARA